MDKELIKNDYELVFICQQRLTHMEGTDKQLHIYKTVHNQIKAKLFW